MDDIPRSSVYRFLETLPAVISWSFLIGPFVAAFWFPRAATIFISLYILAWFLRILKSNWFLASSYLKSARYQKIDWQRLLMFFSDTPPLADPKNEFDQKTITQVAHLKKNHTYKKWDEIYHVIIMPTYKEDLDILTSSLELLGSIRYPREKLIFVLATEERDFARATENSAYLEKHFKDSFGQFYCIMHPKDVAGEMPAKGANITYASRKIVEILADQKIDPSNVLVTTLDADNRPHPLFFEVLTYHYLMADRRNRKTYQPLNFFYNNIWDVPFTSRIIALGNTFWYLSESGSNNLFNAASYAQSLDMLIEMDFWSRQTIVEDLHQFWRAYFKFKGDHEVVPLFIPVYQDALQNRTYFTSLVGQYKQLRRWAWGCSDLPYIIMKIKKHRREIPLFHAILQLIYLWTLQIMWATSSIIILLNKSIPTILNPAFANSIFVYNFGHMLDIMFTITTVGMIISLWISLITMPAPKKKLSFIFLVFELVLLPFVVILYGALSSLDAQTRLMLNRPLTFVVTEKIRKVGGTA